MSREEEIAWSQNDPAVMSKPDLQHSGKPIPPPNRQAAMGSGTHCLEGQDASEGAKPTIRSRMAIGLSKSDPPWNLGLAWPSYLSSSLANKEDALSSSARNEAESAC